MHKEIDLDIAPGASDAVLSAIDAFRKVHLVFPRLYHAIWMRELGQSEQVQRPLGSDHPTKEGLSTTRWSFPLLHRSTTRDVTTVGIGRAESRKRALTWSPNVVGDNMRSDREQCSSDVSSSTPAPQAKDTECAGTPSASGQQYIGRFRDLGNNVQPKNEVQKKIAEEFPCFCAEVRKVVLDNISDFRVNMAVSHVGTNGEEIKRSSWRDTQRRERRGAESEAASRVGRAGDAMVGAGRMTAAGEDWGCPL